MSSPHSAPNWNWQLALAETATRPLIMGMLAVVVVSGGCDRLHHASSLKTSGTVELTEHAVGARVAGRVQTLLVEEGDAVVRGQLLATLDRAEQARKEYERLRTVYQSGGASLQSVEQAELAWEDQRVVSPVDGVVLVKVREPGEVVPAGGPIAVLGDRSALWVRVYVPEGMVNRLSIGQTATVTLDGLARTLAGRVTYIAPRAEFTPRNVQTPEERVTQTFAVKVTLDSPDPSLRPGVAADVILPLSDGR